MVVLSGFQECASDFQSQIPSGSRSETDIGTVDTGKILYGLRASYYFQNRRRHVAFNGKRCLVLSEPDVDRICRAVSDVQLMQVEFCNIGHDEDVEILYWLDIGSYHCPIEVETVEGSVVCDIVCIIMIPDLSVAGYRDSLGKKLQKPSAFRAVCTCVKGVCRR